WAGNGWPWACSSCSSCCFSRPAFSAGGTNAGHSTMLTVLLRIRRPQTEAHDHAIERTGRDEDIWWRGRERRRVVVRAAGFHRRVDRPEWFRQDDAVQFDCRLSPDRQWVDYVRRPGSVPAAGAEYRPPRVAAHVPADPHLRENDLRGKHADQRAVPTGKPARHVPQATAGSARKSRGAAAV